MEIGIVSEFNYLGVLLSKSGNFSMAKKAQISTT
jgi:lipoprotein NlpI